MRKKSWTNNDLTNAVASSLSVRQVLQKINLVPAGGNYVQIQQAILSLKLDTSHFSGKGWRKGSKIPVVKALSLNRILIKGSSYQSFKLKKRLFSEKLKYKKCEECGWAKKSVDGRIPLELDHINGDRYDNRIRNLRVLCPNCHSLKPTHRGRNKTKHARVA